MANGLARADIILAGGCPKFGDREAATRRVCLVPNGDIAVSELLCIVHGVCPSSKADRPERAAPTPGT